MTVWRPTTAEEQALAHGSTHVADIPTGGNPLQAVGRATLVLANDEPGGWRFLAAHDDGCPCVETSTEIDNCTCEIVRLLARRAA